MDLLFLCGILLYVLIRWNALRYGLDEELLCIQSGVLRRELRLIPAGRITVVSAVKYLPLRPFGVFLIQADTPAGGVEWADFRLYLSSRDAARLFQSQAEQAPDLPVEHLYRPGNSSVLLLSLFTSNSLGGLLLVAAFVNNLGDIAGRELSRRVFHTLDNIGRLLTFGIPPAAAMLGYLILFGWGVAFLAEFFRNKNFTAIRTGGVLTINRGCSRCAAMRWRWDRSTIWTCGRRCFPVCWGWAASISMSPGSCPTGRISCPSSRW